MPREIDMDQISLDPAEPPSPSAVSKKTLMQWLTTDWHPILLPIHASIILVLISLFLIPIGISLVVQSNSLVRYEYRYDDKCPLGTSCTLSLDIKESLSAPVYVYYKVKGFPQNQRRYVISRSNEQLHGDSYEVDDCDPKERNGAGLKFYPCGLVAWTYFNDVLGLEKGGTELTGRNWDGSGIAWSTDRSFKFQERDIKTDETNAITRESESLTLPSVGDEDLMVWMRSSAFQTFHKLYRIVRDQDLNKGDVLSLVVDNQFDMDEFPDMEKSVVLSTAGWSGGKNPFLGIIYLVVGSLCLIGGIGIFTALRMDLLKQ